MKTHVIPWMSKEETERLLQELKDEVANRRAKSPSPQSQPKSIVIDIEPPAKSTPEGPKTLDIGSI